jgi:hypothetical protein
MLSSVEARRSTPVDFIRGRLRPVWIPPYPNLNERRTFGAAECLLKQAAG